ncbi:MAG: CdaR family transcriptional regulator, partial [Actinophytocola sp.]|nr:CdaR family transcriptional regulator [Actinophytocola sp.]
MTTTGTDEAEIGRLRERLSDLRGLLVMSLLMTECAEPDQITRLASTSAPALGSWRVEGFYLAPDRWRPGADSRVRDTETLLDRLSALGPSGGDLVIDGRQWSWAFPLKSISGLLGHMVVSDETAPNTDDQFLMQVLAQQTGAALSNAHAHQRERAAATELTDTNAKLEETIATLSRSMDIHNRLTAVAASGEGQHGIAQTVHELTGLAVAVEDRYGNLWAWAGPGRPNPYPKPCFDDRDQLIRRLMRELRPVRDHDRLVVLAQPRPDVIGVLSLIDPDKQASRTELVALEHGATVLSMELARLRGLAEAEMRLRRELVHDLLDGIDDDTAYLRAETVGHDLGLEHRVIVLDGLAHLRDPDAALHGVRRAIRARGLIVLAEWVKDLVVVLASGSTSWEALRQAVMAEFGIARCRLGVGSA